MLFAQFSSVNAIKSLWININIFCCRFRAESKLLYALFILNRMKSNSSFNSNRSKNWNLNFSWQRFSYPWLWSETISETKSDCETINEDKKVKIKWCSSKTGFSVFLPIKSNSINVIVKANYEWKDLYDVSYSEYFGIDESICIPIWNSEGWLKIAISFWFCEYKLKWCCTY